MAPEPALRLFSGYEAGDLEDPRAHPFLFSRLLENGDAADLRLLFDRAPEAEVAAWFAVHGGRQLSRRSRLFWQSILGVEAGPIPPIADALWPL